VSLPREILPGHFYMLQRRCTQRQFLLRPDTATNQTYLYCLAVAARCTGIDIVLTVAMSNHHHTVLYDRDGRISEFTEHFHRLCAKAMNSLRGRSENFWSSEAPCMVRLVDRGDVMDKLVYAATNPVKAGLVERVHQWPGVNSLSALLNGRDIAVRRPRHYFRSSGRMPKEVVLDLVIPPGLGDPDDVRRELRQRVADVEARLALERARAGARVLGRRGIRRQSPGDRPATIEPRCTLRPRIAARNPWSRIEASLRSRAFLGAYRDARLRWLAGLPATFPAGTYWLRRFANVLVATC
jgi:REP element-mobilizing transposase RayT